MQANPPSFPVDPISAATSTGFEVKFGSGSGYKDTAPNSYDLHGKGRIDFEDGQVRISGKRHRLFRSGVPETHVFSRDEIVDAHFDGKYVRFAILHEGIPKRRMGLIAPDQATAAAIVSLLPAAQSAVYRQTQVEQSEFMQRLAYLSPKAPVTPVLVGLNILVFVAMLLAGAGLVETNSAVAIQWGSNFGIKTASGEWWRLLSSTFIHFGILHLALNMLALYNTGQVVERMYGSLHFLVLYLVAGLVGSASSLLWNPLVNSAGASGAIFGVFGGLLAFMSNPRNAVPRSVMDAHRTSTLGFVAFNLFIGFSHPSIDNAAHIGGLVGGFAAGWGLARPMLREARLQWFDKRIALVVLGTAVVLGGMTYRIAHPSQAVQRDMAFQLAYNTFMNEEADIIAATNSFYEQVQAGKLDNPAAAALLESKVLPRWNESYQRIHAAKVEQGSRYFKRWQVLDSYLEARARQYQLLTEGIKTNDASKLQAGKDASKEAEARIEEMKTIK